MDKSVPVSRFSRPLKTSAAAVALTLLLGMLIAVVSGPSTAFADGGTASLSGTVTDASAPGTDIADVSVEIDSQDGQYADLTTTADDGSYAFSAIPAGSYTLSFQPAQGSNFLIQLWQNKSINDPATYFPVADGQVLTGMDAALKPGATISGTVDGVDAPGVGLADVDVEVQSADGGSGSGQASTDADGNYSVVGLPADTYNVQFQVNDGIHIGQWWNNQPTFATAGLVTVGNAAAVANIDAHLAVGATISGRVDVAGSPDTPLAGATVTAFGPGEFTIQSTTTDDSGDYTITALPDAAYTVMFEGPDGTNLGTQYWQDAATLADATPVSATDTHPATGIDAVLSPGATISGTVFAPGKPKIGLANVDVSIFSAVGGGPVASATTNRHGRYSVSGLAAGSYSVSFFPQPDAHAAVEWWGGTFIQTGAKSVTVTAGQTVTHISQQLIVGSKISGTVVDAGTPTSPDGNVEVALWASDQVQGKSATPPRQTNTDASGNYSFPNMGPGTYTIFFGEEGPDFLGQWWKDEPTQAKATRLVVTLNKPSSGVNATLAPSVIKAGTPRIVGQARVGRTLTAKPGVWKPKSIIFTYQWLRNGVAIPGAISTTYIPTTTDIGATLTIAVTGEIPATESEGRRQTVTSAPTRAVRA